MKEPEKDLKKEDDSLQNKKPPPASEEEDTSEDHCRCREVSKKTLPELLKIMLSDFSFRNGKK